MHLGRKEQRKRVDDALQAITIPFLRRNGFRGVSPHFRRLQSDRINLLTFQHSLNDTKFVVEIANCAPEGIITSWGEEIPPAKCTAHDVGMRYRLGSLKHKKDYWFDYDQSQYSENIYLKRAAEVLDLWDEAEQWWKDNSFTKESLP